MARPRRIPGYLIHKRTGNARVVNNGYEHHLGQYGTPASREKYNRLIAEYLAGPSAPPQQTLADRGLTIIEMLAAYLDHAEGYYRRSGELDNIKKALRPLRELYGTADTAYRTSLCRKPGQASTNEFIFDSGERTYHSSSSPYGSGRSAVILVSGSPRKPGT